MCPSCRQPLSGTRIFRFHSTMPERPPPVEAAPEPEPSSRGARALAVMIGGSIVSIAAAQYFCANESDAVLYGAIGSGAALLAGAILYVASRPPAR